MNEQVARLVARQADAISCVSEAIADEMRGLDPRGLVRVIGNGCDFDDFAGLEYTPAPRFRITHTGSFFGKRDPRPFLQAFQDADLDAVVRFVGDFRSTDREWAERARSRRPPGARRLLPRAESLRMQRDSEALLLLVPDAGGRGKGVLSGKVYEYLAAGRPILAVVPPDGAAAELVRETGAGVVAAPDDVDGIRDALVELHGRYANGGLPSVGARDERRGAALAPRPSRGDGELVRGGRVTTHALAAAASAVRDRVLAQPVLDGLFLLTILTVTLHKLQWSVAGSLTLSDILTSVFLVALRVGSHRARATGASARTACRRVRVLRRVRAPVPRRLLQPRHGEALAQWAKGMVKFVLHFGFLVTGIALCCAAAPRFYWLRPRGVLRRHLRWTPLRRLQLASSPRRAGTSTSCSSSRSPSRQTGINVFGAVGGTQEVSARTRSRATRTTSGIELSMPLLVLHAAVPAARARALAEDAAGCAARLPARRRARDALRAARSSGSACGVLVLAAPVPATPSAPRRSSCRWPRSARRRAPSSS